MSPVRLATYVKPPDFVADPPTVVTTTSCDPTVPAGVLAVMLVADATTLVAAAPPTVTVAPDRFVPVIRMLVLPDAGPLEGVTVLTVGKATYTYPLAFVPVPPTVVTVTGLAPAVALAGVTAVIFVPLTTVTDVADTPPIFTTGTAPGASKPVPVTWIEVPPASGPDVASTPATVGAAT
jgi:hypothetical protein